MDDDNASGTTCRSNPVDPILYGKSVRSRESTFVNLGVNLSRV
jgi:hypothetical protein